MLHLIRENLEFKFKRCGELNTLNCINTSWKDPPLPTSLSIFNIKLQNSLINGVKFKWSLAIPDHTLKFLGVEECFLNIINSPCELKENHFKVFIVEIDLKQFQLCAEHRRNNLMSYSQV